MYYDIEILFCTKPKEMSANIKHKTIILSVSERLVTQCI